MGAQKSIKNRKPLALEGLKLYFFLKEALSLLVIWRLPFPPRDPLIEARRREAGDQGLDPLIAVDYPEMGLRLKQGCGRLIRTREDRGIIAILEPVLGTPWEKAVLGALPAGAKIVKQMEALSVLLPGNASRHGRAIQLSSSATVA